MSSEVKVLNVISSNILNDANMNKENKVNNIVQKYVNGTKISFKKPCYVLRNLFKILMKLLFLNLLSLFNLNIYSYIVKF